MDHLDIMYFRLPTSLSHDSTCVTTAVFPLVPHHITLPMEKITLRTGIPIWIRPNHGVIKVQDRKAALAIIQRRCGVLRPMWLRHARVVDAVGIEVEGEAEVVVFEDGGDGCVVCFCR